MDDKVKKILIDDDEIAVNLNQGKDYLIASGMSIGLMALLFRLAVMFGSIIIVLIIAHFTPDPYRIYVFAVAIGIAIVVLIGIIIYIKFFWKKKDTNII